MVRVTSKSAINSTATVTKKYPRQLEIATITDATNGATATIDEDRKGHRPRVRDDVSRTDADPCRLSKPDIARLAARREEDAKTENHPQQPLVSHGRGMLSHRVAISYVENDLEV